jgi:hypothetical protein
MDETRRAFLRSAGVLALGALAGCNSGDSGTPTQPDATGPRAGPDTPTATAATTRSATPEPGPVTTTAVQPGDQPLTADITVGADGSADYRTLAAADRVAEPGDVVGVGVGEYMYTPTTPVTLLGVDAERTTVTVQGLGTADDPYYSGGEPFGVVDCTLRFESPSSRWFRPTPALFERARCTAPVLANRLTAHDTVFEREVSVGALTASDATFQTTVAYTAVDDSGSIFEADLSFERPDGSDVVPQATLTDTVVQGATTFAPSADADSSFTATGATFGERFFLETATTATIEACTLNNLRVAGGADCSVLSSDVLGEVVDRPAVRLDDGDGTTGRTTVEDSTISGGRLSTAFLVRRGDNELLVRDGTVRGRCRGTATLDATFRGTVFRQVGGFDYFMESFEPGLVAGNAFVGADVYATNRDARFYSARDRLGNYYSAYDEPDDDGDGIVDTPRAIPGGEVTDQFPLASSDLSQY